MLGGLAFVEGDGWQWIGLVVIIGLVMITRLVRSLLVHQQKMTQLLQDGRNQSQSDERVLRELAELRNLVVQQSLALDNLRAQTASLPAANPVSDRLNV